MAGSIGLDIGTTGVRVVETISAPRSIRVKQAHALPLDEGVFTGEKLTDPAGLTAALRLLWRDARLGRRRPRLVVGTHPAVLIRAAQIDYVPAKSDRDVFVAQKADQVMPTATGAEDLYLDHHVSGVTTVTDENGAGRRVADIALTGMKRESLDAMLDCALDAGIHPHSVDVTVFALARLLTRASRGESTIDVLVHMGATTVTITGLLRGQFAYQRAINHYSGSQLTQDIADTFMVSTTEAEEAKRLYGTNTQVDPFVQRIDPKQVVSQWTTGLVREIDAACREMAQSIGYPVGRVWLSGGEAGLPSLAAHLGAVLPGHTKVSVLDAAQWVTNPEKLEAATAAGQDLAAALAASVK